MTNVGLIGVGRLGGALARALGPAGLKLAGLIGAGDARATRLGRELGLEQVVVRTANEVLARAELVFLAVPDAAVETLCAALPWTASHAVVHTAGSLGLAALQTARTRGARVGAFHPLQSFAEGAGAARFAGIRVGIEAADAGLCAELEVLCRALGGQPLALAGVDRAGYHAAPHPGRPPVRPMYRSSRSICSVLKDCTLKPCWTSAVFSASRDGGA